MRTQSVDTHPDIERVQIELIRKASPAKIFGLIFSLSQSMIRTSKKSIRELHPDASEEELKILFVELFYGKELAQRVQAHLSKRKQG